MTGVTSKSKAQNEAIVLEETRIEAIRKIMGKEDQDEVGMLIAALGACRTRNNVDSTFSRYFPDTLKRDKRNEYLWKCHCLEEAMDIMAICFSGGDPDVKKQYEVLEELLISRDWTSEP